MNIKFSIKRHASILAVSLMALPLMAGCVKERIFNNGPVISQSQLELIPIGSSQEQVLLSLGSPSTTGQFNNTEQLSNEVYYYISQKRAKTYEFQKAKLIDQRVLSVYFDQNKTVSRIANFGLQDGKVFDFISRTTPTGGKDFTFLKQVLTGKASAASVLQGQTERSGPVQGGL